MTGTTNEMRTTRRHEMHHYEYLGGNLCPQLARSSGRRNGPFCLFGNGYKLAIVCSGRRSNRRIVKPPIE